MSAGGAEQKDEAGKDLIRDLLIFPGLSGNTCWPVSRSVRFRCVTFVISRIGSKTSPQAPDGDWYKDFGSFLLCGSGEIPKTVLAKGMSAFGEPID